MFSCCRDGGGLEALLENSKVRTATVDRKSRTMKLELLMAAPAAPVELKMIEDGIAGEFGLSKVEVTPVFPHAKKEEKSSR